MAPIILSEEMQSAIETKVREHGFSNAGEYISLLVKQDQPLRNQGTGKLSVNELHAMLQEIAEGSENLPVLPPSASTRESSYEDRP